MSRLQSLKPFLTSGTVGSFAYTGFRADVHTEYGGPWRGLGSGAGSTAVQKDAPTVADLVGKLDVTGAEVEQNNVVGNAVESLDVQQGNLAVAGVASTPGSTAGDILPVVPRRGGA